MEKYHKYTLHRTIEKYGAPAQKIMALEEMSELQKEICKDFRGQLNIDNVIEEMADVYIMLEQLKMMYGITTKEIENIAEIKLKRLEERICNHDNS